MNFKDTLFFGSAFLALSAASFAADAKAQTTDAASETTTMESNAIIVTAQRRDQRLQDVPVAVTVATQSSLQAASVGGTDALQQAVPNLSRTRVSAIPLTYIRGVGSSSVAAGTEAAVAFYVDGVYYAEPIATVMDFNNIERVEVLRGPQGTLFGRNATGGLIQVVTKDPNQDPEAEASISYGSYKTITGDLYVSGGITSNLAANLSAHFSDQGKGYGRNVIDGSQVHIESSSGVRIKFLWEPSSETKVRLSADYARVKGDYAMSRVVRPGTRQGGPTVGFTSPGGFYDFYVGEPSAYNLSTGGVALNITQELGAVKLVSISSYRHDEPNYFQDVDNTPAYLLYTYQPRKINTFSQELQLMSNDSGPLSYVLGLYYFDTKQRNVGDLGAAYIEGALGPTTKRVSWPWHWRTYSYAAYADVTYDFGQGTSLTLGGRYTHDNTRINGSTIVSRFDGSSLTLPFDKQKSWGKFTYRGVLQHKFNSDIMAYGSISRGYKSGTTSSVVTNGTVAPFVNPEVIDNFEVGLKSTWFDGRLLLNLAGFHYIWKNQQLSALSPTAPGTFIVRNAGTAKATGIEAEIVLRATDNFTISGGLGYNDGHYSNYPDGPTLVPRAAPAGGNAAGPSADFTGNQLTRSPEFTGNVSAQYTMPTEAGDFSAQLTYYHNSGFPWDADNRIWQEAYGLLSAQIAWDSPDERWRLSLNGANLTDTHYAINGQPGPQGDAYAPGFPRTFTAKVRFKFQ